MIALALQSAFACGQVTHVWTAIHAVDHLPDGPLKQRLSEPEARRALISGAMFPDGGYSPTVQHPYGEASHWEPFQDHVVARVAAQTPRDPLDEAFLLGLAAHGMGDQLYDAAYLHRSGEGQASDEHTDVVIASLWGGHPINDHIVPYDALVPMFAADGITVDRETLERGMGALDLAVFYVSAAGQDPTRVEESRAEAPWATSHLEDDAIPGAPVCLGKTLALYWQAIEQRLDGTAPDLVLESFPAAGGYGHPREGTDAMLSVVFARAMVEATVEAPGRVALVGPDGPVPVDAWMFYRDASNVLNVLPLEPLAEDAEYTLTLEPGMESIGGDVLTAPWSATFSTAPPPEPVSPPPMEEADGCGCRSSGGAGWLVLVVLPAITRRWRAARTRPCSTGPARRSRAS
ncbi:MAG: Ig-like domain-containing protein [Alphaproteobacteria bacterium]|nr:Ig-like domain-containing protein [Alphaproteobacteria bacterium]